MEYSLILFRWSLEAFTGEEEDDRLQGRFLRFLRKVLVHEQIRNPSSFFESTKTVVAYLYWTGYRHAHTTIASIYKLRFSTVILCCHNRAIFGSPRARFKSKGKFLLHCQMSQRRTNNRERDLWFLDTSAQRPTLSIMDMRDAYDHSLAARYTHYQDSHIILHALFSCGSV